MIDYIDLWHKGYSRKYIYQKRYEEIKKFHDVGNIPYRKRDLKKDAEQFIELLIYAEYKKEGMIK